MHAIVRQLDPASFKSVGMYVSPTSVAESQPEGRGTGRWNNLKKLRGSTRRLWRE
jgi:hypothetical protein